MESFFWTIIFAVLHHHEQELQGSDSTMWLSLKEDKRFYNASMKRSHLFLLASPLFLTETSVLFPIRTLLCNLAQLVTKYYYKTLEPGFRESSFTAEEEMEAMDLYIAHFEHFLLGS